MTTAALRERGSFGDGKTPIGAIALSSDGAVLATSHAIYPGSPERHHIRLWELPGGRELRKTYPDDGAGGPLAFSPDGKLLLSGSTFGENAARIWDAATLKLVRALPQPDRVKSVAFSGDNRWIAVAAGNARVFAASTFEELRALEGLKDYVTSLAFTPDSSAVATATFNRDRRVVLWNADAWSIAREFRLGSCVLAGREDARFGRVGRKSANLGSASVDVPRVTAGDLGGTAPPRPRSIQRALHAGGTRCGRRRTN